MTERVPSWAPVTGAFVLGAAILFVLLDVLIDMDVGTAFLVTLAGLGFAGFAWMLAHQEESDDAEDERPGYAAPRYTPYTPADDAGRGDAGFPQ